MNSGSVWHILLVAIFALVLTACGAPRDSGTEGVRLPGEDRVLARVNGSAITQYDLDASIKRTLGAAGAKMLDEAGQRVMLESLVAARAIARKQAQTISPEQSRSIEKQTAAYREQLLVKMYLAQNAPSEPVSETMVQNYYDAHKEQFGSRTVHTYEMLTTEGAMTDDQRDRILAALKAPEKIADWAAAAERLNAKGLPVFYRKATSDAGILEPQLRDIVGRLKTGQCAEPTLVNGRLHILRVTRVRTIPPRPLNEVSADIRKILLPVQLKKAVKQASDQVMKTARVEYTDAASPEDKRGKMKAGK